MSGMVTLNADKTVVAANGKVSVAPVGTALPESAGEVLDAAFGELGYIGEDGVSFSPDVTTEGIKAWQSLQAIRNVLTGFDVMAEFEMMQWESETLTLAFGGGQFTDNLDGTWDFLMPRPGEKVDVAMVIDAEDGLRKYRIVLDRVSLEDVGQINFQRADAARLPITVKALAGETDGRPGAIYGDESAAS